MSVVNNTQINYEETFKWAVIQNITGNKMWYFSPTEVFVNQNKRK